MARKLPDPAERSAKEPATLCTGKRVVALYNNAHGTAAVRVSKKVKAWFLATAEEEGWDSAMFVNDVQTKHSAGCILFKRPNVDVHIHLFLSGD